MDDTEPHTKIARYTAEFIGTFFLVFTIGCNVHNGSVAACISIGFMLMAMIYALGSVSGGHFNPAVTFAVLLSGRGKISNVDAILYMLSQVAGGVAGAVMYRLIFGQAFLLRPVGMYTTSDAWGSEVLWSAALCYVVLNVATTTGDKGNVAPSLKYRDARPETFFAFAIGATVTAASIAVGPISGCCLNPAVSVSSMFVAYSLHGPQAFKFWWPYVLSPFAGALVAFIVFYLARRRYEFPVAGEEQALAPPPPFPKVEETVMRRPVANVRHVEETVMRRPVAKQVVRRQTSKILQKYDYVHLSSLGDVKNSNLFASLSWESVQGRYGRVKAADLDISAVMYDKRGSEIDAVYFAKKTYPFVPEERKGIDDQPPVMWHSGDKVTGTSDATGSSEERINFNLASMPEKVHVIFFCASNFSKTSFEDVKQCSVRLFDCEDDVDHELLRYDKQDMSSGNALIISMLYRRGDDWCFKAIDVCEQIQLHGTYRDLGPKFQTIWKQTVEKEKKPQEP